MEVDNDPRLDMSLDDLIKQNKKEVIKGGAPASRGRGGALRGRRGRGRSGGPQTATAARAENSRNRGTDRRQEKLAEKRGLAVPVTQAGRKPGRGGHVKVRAVPLHGATSSRGRGGRGGIRVGTRGGRGGSLGDFGSIKITIDNKKGLQAPRFPVQQMFPPHIQQAPVVPAWGSAMYGTAAQAPPYQPKAFRGGATAPYVSAQPSGGFQGGASSSAYQGMGRGTRGGGSQGAGHNYVDNPYGSYAGRGVGGRGGMRMNMDMMSGGMSQGHVRVTSNGLRY